MNMEEDPAPEFGQSSIPGVATMIASLMAGNRLRNLARDAKASAMTGAPRILATAGTPLKDLAEFTRQEIDDLTAFAARRGVTADMVAGQARFDLPSTDRRSGSSFNQAENQIRIRRGSVPEVMHEIGHASPIAGSESLRRSWQGIASQLGSGPIGKVIRALLIANVVSPDGAEGTGARPFAAAHAPGLVAATYVPELIEEARATATAMAGARKFGPGAMAVAREMLPAFGTYAAHAAGPVIGTLLAQKIVQALRNRDGEKRAAAMIGKEVQSPGILRSSASSAWRMGVNVPKPKTTTPGTSPEGKARGVPTAKPPSKTAYFSDVIKSLNNPQRGFRQTKPLS